MTVTNSNIEIINPHLMGVRFDWLKAGFITDIPLLKGKVTNQHAALSTDGIIILNRDDEQLYTAFKTMLDSRVMKYTDEQIQHIIQVTEAKRNTSEWDKYTESILFLCQLEQKRRTLEPPKKPRSWLQRLLKKFKGKGA
ncbi:MAG: hypothetical protein HPY50_02045 [Firmicutes bacterium]|nr:hypothetical protein [Bacillota bacterium]